MTAPVTASATAERRVPPPMPGIVGRFPLRTVEGRLGRYSYRETGTGDALVLLHGISSGAASWVHQLAAFEGRYRTIAWDAPGYGESSALLSAAPAAGDYEAALADLLDALGLDRASLVGHSLGALMAAAFARNRPERVTRLVLASPASGHRRAAPEERTRKLDERLRLMAALGPVAHARARASRLLGPDATVEALALIEWNMARLDPEGYGQAARMLADGDILADLASWPRPLLVISGTADTVTPEAACRAVAAAAPLGTYRAIARAGHALPVDAPAQFNEALASFLEDA